MGNAVMIYKKNKTTALNYKGIEIIEGHIMTNHVHMFVIIPPKHAISSVKW